MLAVYLSPLYIAFHLYNFRWLLRWMSSCSHHFKKKWIRLVLGLLYLFFAMSFVTAFFMPQCSLKRTVKLIGNYWLGFTLYMAFVIIIADLLRLLLKRSKRVDQQKLRSRRTFVINGAVCMALILGIGIYGIVNARIVHTTPYEITIDKDGGNFQDMKVVLVADLHLGYNIGVSQITKMVDKINAEDPDLVVIAGDIFDNEYEALEDPDALIALFRQIRSRYGIYACYGNHDINEKILAGFTFSSKNKKESDPRMDEFLQLAGVQLLRDEAVLINDSVYLYGRPDAQRPGRGITERKTPEEITSELDTDKPILVIDHQPRELDELAAAGVDADLCGHTHDGQLFPLNLTSKMLWKNSCGYLQVGNMHNIVTSGVGLFGPNMRVATKAEICSITLHFR